MKCTTHRHPERKTEAEARQKAWAELSPSDQIKSLDLRLGKGMGAEKQRARLVAGKRPVVVEPPVAQEASAKAPTEGEAPASKKLKAKERRAKEAKAAESS